MNIYVLNLLTLGLTLSAWLCTRLGYTFLPPSWDDKPFWIGFLLYMAALVASCIMLGRSFTFAGSPNVPWWHGALMVIWALAQGVLTLGVFGLLYAEGMQGYTDR
ncbi:hypothetical protein ACFSUS_27195 [Spirosoma soli]|uniref:Uncharacterized protein n=1 Tax=Spirosoma soli TaxID=1770529 RepID=A0ABW5MCY5_9BACT